MSATKQYDLSEEIANAVTHGIGALLSVAGMTLLLSNAVADNDLTRMLSAITYGTSLIILFLASTLYHSLIHEKAKQVFKLLDHCSIYLLIAGTYTPLLAVTLGDGVGMPMLITIWIAAIAGVIFKILYGNKYKKISLATYLLMGFMSLVIIGDIVEHLAHNGVILLIAGGLSYSLGVIFYVQKKIPYNHAIWHLFVLAGALCHFFMIFNYV